MPKNSVIKTSKRRDFLRGMPNGVKNELPLGTKEMLFLGLLIKDVLLSNHFYIKRFKSSFVPSFGKNSHTNLEHRV